jgi:hypothetical protein
MRQNVRIWSLGLQYSTMGLRYLALGLQYFKENFRNLSLVSQSQSQVLRSLTANFNYLKPVHKSDWNPPTGRFDLFFDNR